MNFKGTLRGVDYTDAKEYAAAVKASVATRRVSLPAKPRIFVKPSVTLTAAEKEWLGAAVRRSDGLEGQVWALAPSAPGAPQGLWLVADGEAFRADAASVTRL